MKFIMKITIKKLLCNCCYGRSEAKRHVIPRGPSPKEDVYEEEMEGGHFDRSSSEKSLSVNVGDEDDDERSG